MGLIPAKHQALVLETLEEGLGLSTISTPELFHGNAIVRVLAVETLSYHREVYNGERKYSFPKPLVGGCSAIARIEAVAPDAVALTPGQLVFADCVIRARDDTEAIFLSAIHEGGSVGSKKLMSDVWRDGTFAEFARWPLENCIPLNEIKLCNVLGYAIPDLIYISHLLVGYGGLRDIALQAGEQIVVCPATGGFGGAAVQVATALGARVIAMGRNETELARLNEHVTTGFTHSNLVTVKMTGDEAKDMAALQAFGTIDAVIDFSPPQAMDSTHLKSAIMSLRRGGRCSLMGFNTAFTVMWKIVGSNISLKGKLMYEREDIVQLVKMLEGGLFPKGKDLVNTKTFSLKDWSGAFDEAATYSGIGKMVTIVP